MYLYKWLQWPARLCQCRTHIDAAPQRHQTASAGAKRPFESILNRIEQDNEATCMEKSQNNCKYQPAVGSGP